MPDTCESQLSTPYARPPKRVLIIEDTSDFSELLKQLLESEGYEVSCASNGKEGLEHLCSTPELPHLILLDLMMPIMDGAEFRRRQVLDPRLCQIPVVIMTAHRDVQVAKMQLGARDFIRKPPEIDQILAVIRRTCP